MKNKNVWQAVKFTLFSASAGLIQLISFALLHDVFKIPDYNACYLPSLILFRPVELHVQPPLHVPFGRQRPSV